MKEKRSDRWVTLPDFALLVIMVVGYAVSLLVPRRWDPQWIQFAQTRWLSLRENRVRNLASIIEATLLEIGATQSLLAAQDHYRLLVELWWGRFRSVGPRGWRPEIEMEGREHLDAALAKGRGAVLWLTRFTENSVSLHGLAKHGMSVVHLSNEGHGSPDCSRLGIRWAARLYRRAEDPYVLKRIRIPKDGTLGYMRRLLACLEENRVVSIVGENRGRQNVDGVVLGRPVSFASGAPSLAERTGAELLTAYSIRLAPFRYRVVIEPPLASDRESGRKKFIRECVAEYCRRLERNLRDHPAEWLGWQRGDSSIPVRLAAGPSEG